MTRYRYGQSWGDMEMTPRARSWRMLRALRHHPPGLAAADESRRTTFVAALEQSEQFFTAAAGTGPQTRGLLLFYGLSQAGRALRAAQQEGEAWARSGGHGIKVVGESTSGSFADARVCDIKREPSDAFGWVATTLNRASLRESTAIGDLARLLFPNARFALAGEAPKYAALELAAVPDQGLILGRHGSGLRADLRVPASTWEMRLPDAPDRTTADYDAYKDHVRSQLDFYPTLRGAQLYEATPGHFQPGSHYEDNRKMELVWPDLDSWDGQSEAVLHRFSDENRSTVRVWPTLPGGDADETALAAHPFLLWWAVLYGFSHFVRYEPARWADLVDVDASDEAVALEEIGDVALDALPELIHKTLVRDEPQ